MLAAVVVGAQAPAARVRRGRFRDAAGAAGARLRPPGNFINGELWGKPTGGDWGVVFPSVAAVAVFRRWTRPRQRVHSTAGALDPFLRHPSQLYQVGLEGLALFCVPVVVFVETGPRLPSPLVRAVVRRVPLRGNSMRVPTRNWLPRLQLADHGQLLRLPLIAFGLFWLWLSRRSPTL